MGGCTRGYGNGFLKLSVVCMVTQLSRFLSFLGGSLLQNLREISRLCSEKKLFLASTCDEATANGQGPSGRWQSAASSEGGRDRCSVASADGSAEAAADCGTRGAGRAFWRSGEAVGAGQPCSSASGCGFCWCMARRTYKFVARVGPTVELVEHFVAYAFCTRDSVSAIGREGLFWFTHTRALSE